MESLSASRLVRSMVGNPNISTCGKWKKKREPYLKNEIVFGLNRAKQYFEEWKKIAEGVYVRPSEHRLIVCEGELNAICLHALGYRGAVAINGSYFGQRQMRLIREYADSVTLFFDTDQAGSDATTAVSEELSPFMPVRVVPDHEGDPAVMHGYSIRCCIEQAKPYREILLLRS